MSTKKPAKKPKSETPNAAAKCPVEPPREKYNDGKPRKSYTVWQAFEARAKALGHRSKVTRADSFDIGFKLKIPFSKMNNYFYRWRRFHGINGFDESGKNIGNRKIAKKPTTKAKPSPKVSKPAPKTKPAPKKTKAKKAPTALQVATKRSKKLPPVEITTATPETGTISGAPQAV